MRQSKADTLKNAAFRKLYHGGKPKSRQFGPLKAEKGKIGNCNKICRSGEGQLLQCAYRLGWPNCNLATGPDAPLGSPSGGAGCPLRGRLRGPHGLISGAITLLRYPLSQPVRLTALPKGEPRGTANASPNYNLLFCFPATKNGCSVLAAPVRHPVNRKADRNRWGRASSSWR